MADDEDFEPRLGRMRAGGRGKRARKFLHRVLAAANLARGGVPFTSRKSGFTGSRIGRGAGVGRVLSARDRYAAFRRRRVIVKARTVRLKGKGLQAAQAHLRYVERDGTTREGGRGQLYGAEADRVDRAEWIERAKDDRHQFRFIVSPEDGADYEDLKPLTRRLMSRLEEDLGTRLDWVAVDHFNTGHPHTHIIVRGKDDRDEDLIIARDYISHGLRERACELVDLDLGPRSDQAIEQRLRAEVGQERLTSIDRSLIREAEGNVLASTTARGAFDQSIRMGRLKTLERLGLARQIGASHWRLSPDLADTLRGMGERGDIIRTMQRAYAARENTPALADQVIYDPGAPDARPLVGRIVERGLADEINDRHYLIVEATDGRSHYVAIGRGENLAATNAGAIVRIAPAAHGVRQADRTVTEVAAANEGRYTIDAHLKHDPSATQGFAETHVRRLEAMRRLARNVEREPDGSWIIAPDHLDKVAAYEAARAKDRPVAIDMLSSLPLEKLVDAEAATWIDRELVATPPEPLRDAGFGRDVRATQIQRRQWLIEQDLAEERAGRISYRSDLIAALQRRELLRVAGQLSEELGMPFVEAGQGERIDGRLGRMVEMTSGRYALIEKSREFTLVPWRSVLERQIGKPVAGIMRGDGISWTIGRGRSGPSIS
ncbi:relaxase/mobilization nuclease RlxS [Stakelama sediminis]|uniref:Type IV secretory pathway VirD2 relaxase n=1 Tax=Stakelama sediminis TaxID=463200 RepID=A0A840Z397_9SPHN|nr:relaxase/mobilization nuclease RlxS [Stakelama sediminis]MBB5720200.1 type IV secretory pathway VirD2 relaxase [Stakelama sediminis]